MISEKERAAFGAIAFCVLTHCLLIIVKSKPVCLMETEIRAYFNLPLTLNKRKLRPAEFTQCPRDHSLLRMELDPA